MNRTILNRILAGAVVALALLVVWNIFDVGTRWKVNTAVEDLLAVRQPARAKKRLDEAGDRGMVVAALKSALASSDGDVWGKWWVLEALTSMKETRAVRRAIESENVDTRRAAAYLKHNEPEWGDRSREIALEWLNDTGANNRQLAAQMCQRLKAEESVPALLAILEMNPTTNEDNQLLASALATLVTFESRPPGLGDKMYELATNENVDPRARQAALNNLARVDDVDATKVQDLAIRLIKDPRETNLVRAGASNILRKKKHANERTITALESVLLSETEDDAILQRLCLNGLGEIAPLDRVKELLLHPRVYGHAFHGIRVDVATGLAALNARDRLTLEIMCDFLVDEDRYDETQRLVRREGWLTLFTLTGINYGVKEKRLFRNPPAPLKDPAVIREFLWSPAFLRNGISHDQNNAVEKIAHDLRGMKKIRQTYLNHVETILETWKKQDEAEQRKQEEKADQEKRDAEREADDQGPLPPPGTPGD